MYKSTVRLTGAPWSVIKKISIALCFHYFSSFKAFTIVIFVHLFMPLTLHSSRICLSLHVSCTLSHGRTCPFCRLLYPPNLSSCWSFTQLSPVHLFFLKSLVIRLFPICSVCLNFHYNTSFHLFASLCSFTPLPPYTCSLLHSSISRHFYTCLLFCNFSLSLFILP